MTTFKQFVKEEYTYMIDQLPIEVKGIRMRPTDEGYSIADWKTVRKYVLYFFEAEYKRSMLAQRKIPSPALDRMVEKLFVYFETLWAELDAMFKDFEKDFEQDMEAEEIPRLYGDANMEAVRAAVEKGRTGDIVDKIQAINLIINEVHTEEILIAKYIRGANINYDNSLSNLLDTLHDATASRRFTQKWNKELEQEFGRENI